MKKWYNRNTWNEKVDINCATTQKKSKLYIYKNYELDNNKEF